MAALTDRPSSVLVLAGRDSNNKRRLGFCLLKYFNCVINSLFCKARLTWWRGREGDWIRLDGREGGGRNTFGAKLFFMIFCLVFSFCSACWLVGWLLWMLYGYYLIYVHAYKCKKFAPDTSHASAYFIVMETRTQTNFRGIT